jgi:DNA-binding NtrC family response regulator
VTEHLYFGPEAEIENAIEARRLNLENIRTLIVDDDFEMRRMIRESLERKGHEVVEAEEGGAGIEALESNGVHVILSDWKMKGMDGMEFISRARYKAPTAVIIMITSFSSIESAVEAMSLGADSYISKPFILGELYETIEKALKRKEEIIGWTDRLTGSFPHGIISEAKSMQRVFQLIEKVKDSEATILLQGESGTGKELVARAIHRSGKHRRYPMVALNCAALPENILESELFGHVRGAFTGAEKNKIGLFLEAENGILFLDEIGDMSIGLQGKLLRALQEREVRPVGSNKSFRFHTRVIAATHQDLKKLISNGLFREDLYFRLNVIPVRVPPLRERVDDIPLLASHFLKKYGGINHREFSHISEQGMQFLKQKPWKGNVRELENYMERTSILAEGPIVELEDFLMFEDDIDHIPASSIQQRLFEGNPRLEQIEKDYILKIYKESQGNKDEAAQILGISKRTLYRKITRYLPDEVDE